MTTLQTGSNEPNFDSPLTNGIDVPHDYGVKCPICNHEKNITNKCSECGFPIAVAKKSIQTILNNAIAKKFDKFKKLNGYIEYIDDELNKRKWYTNLDTSHKFIFQDALWNFYEHIRDSKNLECGTLGYMFPCDCPNCTQPTAEQVEEVTKTIEEISQGKRYDYICCDCGIILDDDDKHHTMDVDDIVCDECYRKRLENEIGVTVDDVEPLTTEQATALKRITDKTDYLNHIQRKAEEAKTFNERILPVLVNKICDGAKNIVWKKMGMGQWYDIITFKEANTYLKGILYSEIERQLTPFFKHVVRLEIDKIINSITTGSELIHPLREDTCTYETVYNTLCDAVAIYLKGDAQLSQDYEKPEMCPECKTPLEADQYGHLYCPYCDPFHNVPMLRAPKNHADWGIFYDKVNKSARRIAFMDGGPESRNDLLHIDDVVFLFSYWEDTFLDMDLIRFIRAINQMVIDQIKQYSITTSELERLIAKATYKIDNCCPKCGHTMWFTLDIDCHPKCPNCSGLEGLSTEEDMEGWLKFVKDIFICHHINKLDVSLSPSQLIKIEALSQKQKLIIDVAGKDKCTIVTFDKFPYPF